MTPPKRAADPVEQAEADDSAEAALRAWGVSEAQLQAGRELRQRQAQADAQAAAPLAPAADDGADLELWAWHEPALRLLQGLGTQWVAVPGLHGLLYTGLNYAGLATVAQAHGIALGEQVLADLRDLERAGARVLSGMKGAA